MALQHVNQDPAVFERRLRPIYDNLEVGNNRKALQETEKVLRKNPNLLCARALKGLALLRLGRYEESHVMLQAVAGEKPVDDPTLQVLSFCYKEMEQLDKIVDLYAYAVKKTPGNEELLAHLFISHVRMEDFQSQQSAALQLYKAQPKNAYYFWAVMSVVLQATRGPERNNSDKRKIFLALAQRMVDRFIKEDKLESEQEVLLYLNILKLQNKHEEALEFLTGELFTKLYPGVPIFYKINLYKHLGKWQELNLLLRELLMDERDRWDYYLEYIFCCFELLREKRQKQRLQQQQQQQHQEQQQEHEQLKNGTEEKPEATETTESTESTELTEATKTTESSETKETTETTETTETKETTETTEIPETTKITNEEAKNDNEEQVDVTMSVLDECHDFLCGLIESKKVRGPFLARLELHKRMRELELDAEALLGDFASLVVEYFHLFGDKSCFTNDIATFLPSIAVEKRHELASRLSRESGVNSLMLPETKEQMQKHICALQIARICGAHIDKKEETLLARFTALKLHYEHGLYSFGKDLLCTDMGPFDAYALLAANVMYDISIQKQQSHHLFEALCLLQYVLRNSTSNFHVKLLSLKIYHMLGCVLGAQEMYEYLDIKQIQLDSMGYIHCGLIPLCGRFSMVRNVFDATLKFFNNSYKDRLEYIALTYRFCTFSKLEEFMNFKNRLANSLHNVAITVETQLCDLVTFYGTVQQNLTAYTAMNVDPANDRIPWVDLSDNRDLSAIVRWDPIQCVQADADRKESFDQEVELLHIRSMILRLVAACVDLYHPPPIGLSPKQTTTKATHASATNIITNSNSHTNSTESEGGDEKPKLPPRPTSTLELLLDSWKSIFKRLRVLNYKPLSNRFLANLLPTRLHLMLEMPYEKFFSDLGQLILDLFAGANSLAMRCKAVTDNVNELVKLCGSIVKESDAAVEDGLWRRREWQQKVSACLEILAIYTFILSVLHEKIQPPAKTKSRKKSQAVNNEDNQVVSEKERSQLVVEMTTHLLKQLQACEIIIRNWKSPALPHDLNSFMSDMSLKPEVEAVLIGDVSSIFKESHDMMVMELKNLIKDKIRMLHK